MAEQQIKLLHDELMVLPKEQIVRIFIKLKVSYQKVCGECNKLQSWQDEHMSLDELFEEYINNIPD